MISKTLQQCINCFIGFIFGFEFFVVNVTINCLWSDISDLKVYGRKSLGISQKLMIFLSWGIPQFQNIYSKINIFMDAGRQLNCAEYIKVFLAWNVQLGQVVWITVIHHKTSIHRPFEWIRMDWNGCATVLHTSCPN